jgi:D-arginine dehydrogenase
MPGGAGQHATDVIVVGGGVAGLSAAALLAPHARVTLLEREPLLASHASGRNAAIHRPLEHDALSARLARRSRELLYAWFGDAVLAASGLVLLSRERASVALLAGVAQAEQVRHALLDERELHARVPALAGGEATHGLLLPDGGVIDLHALTSGLSRLARAAGAQFRTGATVASLLQTAGRVSGVLLRDGERLAAAHVVLAVGAWSESLGTASGFGLPLTPMRRHLVQLTAAGAQVAAAPVVWRLEDEVYFRPESQGLLASPCDEIAWPVADTLAPDPAALLMLAQKLERSAPSLANARVRTSWACLRTFAADRELVVGADARLRGLYWLTGLGGRGMSVAPAAAELLAAELLTQADRPEHAVWTPDRLL